jgi:DNA-binding MarR family transcriptional regulator
VSLPIARVLQFLGDSDEPVTPTEVSRELGRSPAATSELVKRLVNSGWITADLDPSDRRSFHLALTRSGRSKFNDVTAVLDDVEISIARLYGKRKLIDLASSVDSLVEQLKGNRIQG